MKGSGWFLNPPPPLSFLSLFLFYLSCLSVSVSRVCAPTLPLTNNTGSRVYSNEVPSLTGQSGPVRRWKAAPPRAERAALMMRERAPPLMRARQPLAQRLWLKSQETMSPQRTEGEPPSPRLWPQGQANLSLLLKRRSDRLGSR